MPLGHPLYAGSLRDLKWSPEPANVIIDIDVVHPSNMRGAKNTIVRRAYLTMLQNLATEAIRLGEAGLIGSEDFDALRDYLHCVMVDQARTVVEEGRSDEAH